MSNATHVLKITDIVEKTGCSRQTILTWINRGYLPAVKKGDDRRSAFLIREEDLIKFLASEHYQGRPECIRSSVPFTRTPILEECWPINLLIHVAEIPLDSEDVPPWFWDYDIRAFRNLITELNDREQRVLECRYQLGMTLDECAKAFNLGRERIRQIQVRAERKLRHWSCKKHTYIVDHEKYEKLQNDYKALQAKCIELEHQLESMRHDSSPEKETHMSNIEDALLEDLDLSIRIYNCLKRAGINTVGDILYFDQHQGEPSDKFRYESWWHIRNLGRGSLIELARYMYNYCKYRIHEPSGEPVPLVRQRCLEVTT